jgi:hypothetical protein
VIAQSMENPKSIVLLFKFVVVVALLILFWRHFRGGRPPRPMHPSPADDAALLLRRRSIKPTGLKGFES